MNMNIDNFLFEKFENKIIFEIIIFEFHFLNNPTIL